MQNHAREGGTTYDEIGDRTAAVVPIPTAGPLTLGGVRRLAGLLDPPISSAEAAVVSRQAPLLRHRPVAMPPGPFRHTVDGGLIDVTPTGNGSGVVWSFPFGAAPDAFLGDATEREGPRLLDLASSLPWVRWLPLPELIRTGRFERMQNWRDRLVTGVDGGEFRCFVSHRWLDRTRPDPDGRQAALVAWQLVAAVCDAVCVAHDRGLHVPRRWSPSLAAAVGRAGSDLVEALIVNVLQECLDDTGLASVRSEVVGLDEIAVDGGVGAGRGDVGLARLRDALSARPLVADLLDRVRLWYDYSCLPQEPRTVTEQAEFEQGRDKLLGIQMVSRTAVLIDDLDTFLGRAWCALEVLNNNLALGVDVLPGSARSARAARADDHVVQSVSLDRQHVVWRALLDTDVFGVQTPREGLGRLGLTTGRDEDVPSIHAGLRLLGAPPDVRVGDGDMVTGTFPLPAVGRTVHVPVSVDSPRAWDGGRSGLDWSAALRLPPVAVTTTDSFLYTGRQGTTTCHVVVVGACEGESVLLSNWALSHAAELERPVSGTVVSLSWLSADDTPVGHFTGSGLRTRVIAADTWVVVCRGLRFGRCTVFNAVLRALLATGDEVFTLDVGSTRDNLVARLPAAGPPDSVLPLPRTGVSPARWHGGLYRGDLVAELLAATTEVGR